MKIPLLLFVSFLNSVLYFECLADEVIYEKFAEAIHDDDIQVVVVSPVSVDSYIRWMDEEPETAKLVTELRLAVTGNSIHVRTFEVCEHIGGRKLPRLIPIFNTVTMDRNPPFLPVLNGSQWLVAVRKASAVSKKGELLEGELLKLGEGAENVMVVEHFEELDLLTAVNLVWPEDTPEKYHGLISDIPPQKLVDEMRNVYAVSKLTEGLSLSGKEDEIAAYVELMESKISRGVAEAALRNLKDTHIPNRP